MTVSPRKSSLTPKTMAVFKEDKKGIQKPASFEEAIELTGFGIFNILLMILIVPSLWAIHFESSIMSFVFPVAQCDLNLTLQHKGILNATPYIGMMLSCFFWGILCDKYGRRKTILAAFFTSFCLTLISSISMNFPMLVVLKFLGGFISNGPATTMPAYICEMHSTRYRSKMQIFIGMVYSIGNISIPLMASIILPIKFHRTFFDNFIILNSWNLFILASSLSSLIAGVGFIFMPESPKFYMSKGQNEKALKVFRTMFKLNHRNTTYPITQLVDERTLNNNDMQDKEKNCKDSHKNNFLLLIKNPYLKNLLIVCLMNICIMLSVNTLRLWLPQIFQAIHENEIKNNATSSSICDLLEIIKQASNEENLSTTCSVNNDNNLAVYLRSMVIGMVAFVGYVSAMFIINRFEKKKIILTCGLTAGTFVICLFLSPNTETILALSSLSLALTNLCVDVIITIVVVIFPTSIRASALSVISIFGKFGSITGNLVFPFLLQTGCIPPFLLLGCLLIGAVVLSTILPNTDTKSIT
ncbi:unnamed protein product [Brassicogethes aeneus]|uniref:Major facilitator superfamily (MFS) profile domain-containing protein n=1 Tax=Brassicogethes aeneus TaxID=1431903 RepID=A0A9P0B336_BRAAE|nr:unnamed protein product [Brassicogethes aeneus]